MFEFYFGTGSIAFAALIALEEVDTEYLLHFVELSQGEQLGKDYLEKNPKGRVPLLETPQGAISETPAILTYLAATFPERNLAPSDTYRYAKMQECLSYFASTFHVNHAHSRRGSRWANDESSFEAMRQKVPETMNASATYVEQHLLEGPYLLGDYSVADMHLYAISNWFEGDGVDLNDYPRLKAWHDLMNSRPAVQKAINRAERR